MKKLTLLLTSLLLTAGANAGIIEFNTPQVDEWQDVQVAHRCEIILYTHVPEWGGIHGGGMNWGDYGQGYHDGSGHVKIDRSIFRGEVKCVKKSKIKECAKQNRVVVLPHLKSPHCGDVCPVGKKPGEGRESYKCVDDGCLEGTVWQSQHKKCVSVGELITYCLSINQSYNRTTRQCETCPAGSFPQASGCLTLAALNDYCRSTNPVFVYGVSQNSCVSLFDMREYCKTEFGKDYNPSTAECVSCPTKSYPQKSGCRTLAELNAHCNGVKSGDVYGVAQDACVSELDMRRYCKDAYWSTYNKDTAECEKCPEGHHPQDSGCVSEDALNEYCSKDNDKSYSFEHDACVCPENEYPHPETGKCWAKGALDAFVCKNSHFDISTGKCHEFRL